MLEHTTDPWWLLGTLVVLALIGPSLRFLIEILRGRA